MIEYLLMLLLVKPRDALLVAPRETDDHANGPYAGLFLDDIETPPPARQRPDLRIVK